MNPLTYEPETSAEYLARALGHIECGEWDSARECALLAGTAAEANQNLGDMARAGECLERLNEFGAAGRLLAKYGRAITHETLPEWDGTNLPDVTILIEQRIRDIGAPIRNARLIPAAAKRVQRCIVLSNSRLAPLFRRSFAGVDIRIKGTDEDAARAEADVVASFETLMQHLTPDSATVEANFARLHPDPELLGRFRDRYRPAGARLPVVGVSWASTNKAKDLPPIGPWVELVRNTPARFVSLQYGDASQDLASFQQLGAVVHDDPTVDSLRDLDTFAAQIASLDAVVTISNTAAHMAGALAVPTFVVLDDKLHLSWPVGASNTPWYPRTTMVRKNGRDWHPVFAEVHKLLLAILRT